MKRIILILILVACLVAPAMATTTQFYAGLSNSFTNSTANQTFSVRVTNTSATTLVTSGNTEYALRLLAGTLSPEYAEIRREFITFPTGTLGASATVTAATIVIIGSTKTTGLGTFNLSVVQAYPANDANYTKNDYSKINKSITFATDIPYNLVNASGGATIITVNNLSLINKTGNTTICLLATWDRTGTFTGSWVSGQGSDFVVDSQRNAGNVPYINVTYTLSNIPLPSFTSNITSAASLNPVPVQFNDTSITTITAWDWSFTNSSATGGNGTTVHWSTSQNATLSFGPGNWSIALNVTNATGFNTTTTPYFINVTYPAPVALFTVDKTIGNAPLTVTFTDMTTNLPYKWNYSFGDGNYSNSQNPVYTFTVPGTYTPSLNATNINGSNTYTMTGGNIVVGVPPTTSPTPTPSPTPSPPTIGDHPYLLFHDPSTMQGMIGNNRLYDPWKTDLKTIMTNANASLSDNEYGSYSEMTAAYFARDAALAYQIWKGTNLPFACSYGNASLRWQKAAMDRDMKHCGGQIVNGSISSTNPCGPEAHQSGGTNPEMWYIHSYALAFDWTANQSCLNMSNQDYYDLEMQLAFFANRTMWDTSMSNSPRTGGSQLSIADRQGDGYAAIYITGAALGPNYTVPTPYSWYNISTINSTPTDWAKFGPVGFATSDPIAHSSTTGKGIFAGMINDTNGINDLGSYYYYFMGGSGSDSSQPGIVQVMYNVWSYMNNQSVFDAYPFLKQIQIAEPHYTLPFYYQNNWGTSGAVRRDITRSMLGLLDTYNASVAHWWLVGQANMYTSMRYPYITTSVQGTPFAWESWVYEPNITTYIAPTTNPDWLFNNADIAQVIRKDWTEKSDWVSLRGTNLNTGSNRDMMHHDQLSFDYVSKGTDLMADSGETKYLSINGANPDIYGYNDVQHNVMLIENLTAPWTTNYAQTYKRGNITAHGSVKSANIANGIYNNATFGKALSSPAMSFMQANITIRSVEGYIESSAVSTGSPIDWNRQIFMPNKDYTIVVDRTSDENGTSWGWKDLFRLTSYNIVPSWGTNIMFYVNSNGTPILPRVGHVLGDVYINGSKYDWFNITNDGKNATGSPLIAPNGSTMMEMVTLSNDTQKTNLVVWKTQNPYNETLYMNVMTVPSTNVTISNYYSNMGSYSATGNTEVISPQVYFNSANGPTTFRITAINTNTSGDTPRTPTEYAVTGGTGTAMSLPKVGSNDIDYIYTGTGNSSFATLNTDADTMFVRKYINASDFTIINGTHIYDAHNKIFNSTVRLDYATVNRTSSGEWRIYVSGAAGTTNITLYNVSGYINGFTIDGQASGNISKTGTTVNIWTALSDHTIGFTESLPPAEVSFTASTTACTPPCQVVFNDTSITNILTWNWSFTNATPGNNTQVWWSQSRNTTQTFGVGSWNIVLNVSNASGIAISSPLNINVSTPISGEIIAQFKKSAFISSIRTPIIVNDTSLGSPQYYNWSWGDGTFSYTRNATHTYSFPGSFPIIDTVSTDVTINSTTQNVWVYKFP